jgi:hypothetical protein
MLFNLLKQKKLYLKCPKVHQHGWKRIVVAIAAPISLFPWTLTMVPEGLGLMTMLTPEMHAYNN